ncbi:MAG TPA: hypothetical protein VG713_17165 [Pirellulales bacterium]|nr:hypothetical protein [Pirellulales bacterium]
MVIALVAVVGCHPAGERLAALPVVLFAAAVCWVPANAALLVSTWFHGTRHAVASVLAGTLMRTGIPMLIAMLLQVGRFEWAAQGVFGYIMVFFLVSLAVETALVARLISRSTARPAPAVQ